MIWMDYARMAFALLATLALIGAIAWGARRFGMLEAPRPHRERRIAIVESLMIDPRRRLVLVRCGESEHLVLLSPAGDRRIATQSAREERPS